MKIAITTKKNQNKDGYNSEGSLPHFSDVKEDDMETYDEAPIIFPTAVPAPAPEEQLTVEAAGGARSEGVEGRTTEAWAGKFR